MHLSGLAESCCATMYMKRLPELGRVRQGGRDARSETTACRRTARTRAGTDAAAEHPLGRGVHVPRPASAASATAVCSQQLPHASRQLGIRHERPVPDARDHTAQRCARSIRRRHHRAIFARSAALGRWQTIAAPSAPVVSPSFHGGMHASRRTAHLFT